MADVLRDHASALRLSDVERRAVAHILACRTGQLGGHLAVCDHCGAHHFAYHSCRDRHCPRCGSLDQALWAEAQLPHLLPVSYFHLVFTVPASLRPFFAGVGRAQALDALFEAVSETLIEMGERNLGVRLGLLTVLHTWTQRLEFHPHIHCLLTGGGLGADRWVHRRRYLLPLKNLRFVFRGKLLDKLGALLKAGTLTVARSSGHDLLRDASRRTWQLYIKPPLTTPEHVIAYFARYTRRIAISDARLLRYDGERITFRWRDRAHGNRVRLCTLDGPTFCRRFLRHVLPPRFVRIRRYGILSNRVRGRLLDRCRALIDARATAPTARGPESRTAACLRLFGVDPSVCQLCHKGHLVVRLEWGPTRRPITAVLRTVLPRAP